jgi:non-ribosomal peptide synthetase component F
VVLYALDRADYGGYGTGDVTYAVALFERATVERFVGYLGRALEAMVADESQPVDRLPLLPGAERRLVVEEWNATGRAYPTDGLRVHDLFRAQAARTPEAVALSWQGERLTYAELDARANRLANALRRLGLPKAAVRMASCSAGAWAMARHAVMQRALNNQTLTRYGFIIPW